MRWRAEARSEPTGICLRCWSYNAKGIGRTVSCEAMLAYFSRVCSAFPKRGVSLAVGHSPMQDAAFYELSSMVEVCFQLFSSLRRETLPCSSSIYRQLSLVGFCKSPPSELATCSAESARAELVLFEISLL